MHTKLTHTHTSTDPARLRLSPPDKAPVFRLLSLSLPSEFQIDASARSRLSVCVRVCVRARRSHPLIPAPSPCSHVTHTRPINGAPLRLFSAPVTADRDKPGQGHGGDCSRLAQHRQRSHRGAPAADYRSSFNFSLSLARNMHTEDWDS